jgi:hypothetical protein
MSSDEIARLERLAEAAYTRMYDAPSHLVHDCYEDAMLNFGQAIELAEKVGMNDIALRLEKRKDHVYNVYTHQFR